MSPCFFELGYSTLPFCYETTLRGEYSMRRSGLRMIGLLLVLLLSMIVLFRQFQPTKHATSFQVRTTEAALTDNAQKTRLPARTGSNADKRRFVWPRGETAAVSITYDDGLQVHFEKVAPMLREYGLYGTFYPPGLCSLIRFPREWAEVAAMGHELGNHSLFHPCRRDGINPAYNLENYNETRWRDEMAIANFILKTIDGKENRTFAVPCAQIYVGSLENKKSVVPLIAKMFVAGRSYFNREIITPDNINFVALPSFAADLDLQTSDRIISVIKESQKISGWVIFTFHDIKKDGGYLSMDEEEHRKLLLFLSENKTDIWVSPIIEVCRYLKSKGY